MKIALDFDNTFTKDSIFWYGFIADAHDNNHEVRIVTARAPEEDNIDEFFEGICDVIYCDGIAKRFFCTWFADDRRGWIPDIWIDDKPESVDNNSPATRAILEEWRKNREV